MPRARRIRRIAFGVVLATVVFVVARVYVVIRSNAPVPASELEIEGDAAPAEGRWSIEISDGEPTPFLWSREHAVYRGEMDIRAVRPPALDPATPRHRDQLFVRLRANLTAMAREYPATIDGVGEMTRAGRLVLMVGKCCDQGSLEFVLEPAADGYVGRWRQQFISGGMGGRARLSRVETGKP